MHCRATLCSLSSACTRNRDSATSLLSYPRSRPCMMPCRNDRVISSVVVFGASSGRQRFHLVKAFRSRMPHNGFRNVKAALELAVPTYDIVGERKESTIGTLSAFDARLLADASDPLVGTGGRVAGFAGLAALESPRVHVVAASEERSKEGDLCLRRRCLIDRPGEQVHEVEFAYSARLHSPLRFEASGDTAIPRSTSLHTPLLTSCYGFSHRSNVVFKSVSSR